MLQTATHMSSIPWFIYRASYGISVSECCAFDNPLESFTAVAAIYAVYITVADPDGGAKGPCSPNS